MQNINTLGQLKKSGYQSKSVKEEIRANLVKSIQQKEQVFTGIIGYEDTVIPDTERAILSRHNILFLGLRGQAKTRMARQMVDLLDEYIPIIAGSEINDDPLKPLSKFARDLIAEHGDETPIRWIHKSERYGEKLATPDVSVADLIGDIDPIKAANLKLSFSDEEVIHYGIIPRSNRGIFVINELPDLQARIQVALFNILQEGDIQIRGFKLRMPLDILFVFTANPDLTAFILVGGWAQFGPQAYAQNTDQVMDRLKSKDLIIIAGDTLPPQVQAFNEGRSHFQIGQRPYQMGNEAPDILIELIGGGTVEDPKFTGLDLCTLEDPGICAP